MPMQSEDEDDGLMEDLEVGRSLFGGGYASKRIESFPSVFNIGPQSPS